MIPSPPSPERYLICEMFVETTRKLSKFEEELKHTEYYKCSKPEKRTQKKRHQCIKRLPNGEFVWGYYPDYIQQGKVYYRP